MTPTEIFQYLAANPQILAALLALIYNLAGYIMSMLKVQGLEAYQVSKLVETLVMFEVLFTILVSFAGVPASWTAVITVVLAVVISIKDKLSASIRLQQIRLGIKPT